MNVDQELANRIQHNLKLWSVMRIEAAAVEDKLRSGRLNQSEYPSQGELDKVTEANRFWDDEVYSLLVQTHPEK